MENELPEDSLGAQVRRRLIAAAQDRQDVDLVIMANEINFAHGTGILMSRILAELPSYVLFRAFDHWGGMQVVEPTADFVLHRYSQDRQTIAGFVASRLPPYAPRSIFSVPYTREDVVMALTAKAMTGAPLVIWVMDDNCLSNEGIPLALMRELVLAADARFVISDVMRATYEAHFGLPFWVLPPLVARRFIRTEPCLPPPQEEPLRGAIVGNIWHQAWLEDAIEALSGVEVPIEWYTSSNDLHFLKYTDADLARAGIVIKNDLTHDEIAVRVERSAFILVPSFSGTETDGHAAAIGRLSLPSKMPFVTATAGTPFLVLTNGESGAADYVRTFDLGEVAAYDQEAIIAAINRIADPDKQYRVRERSFAIAPALDVTGLHGFLVDAARNRSLTDDRFELLFSTASLAGRERSDCSIMQC
ncbi:hypothetical protein [Novosphingobium sp. AP12]|uniref:hypothetical protein n=1 Tax=Novosphingobium sp. AP12 TaxID=1144305 RepID=UPI0002F0762F|nr:hypothetical protein [Novosphingobium sp. AP12]